MFICHTCTCECVCVSVSICSSLSSSYNSPQQALCLLTLNQSSQGNGLINQTQPHWPRGPDMTRSQTTEVCISLLFLYLSYLNIYTHIHTYILTHIYKYMHIYVYIHIHKYIYTYTYVYIYIYLRALIKIYMGKRNPASTEPSSCLCLLQTWQLSFFPHFFNIRMWEKARRRNRAPTRCWED